MVRVLSVMRVLARGPLVLAFGSHFPSNYLVLLQVREYRWPQCHAGSHACVCPYRAPIMRHESALALGSHSSTAMRACVMRLFAMHVGRSRAPPPTVLWPRMGLMLMQCQGPMG